MVNDPGKNGGHAATIAHASTAPITSRLWFHTTDKIVYYYDSTRVKWLSVNEYTVDAASTTASSTSNDILQQHGVSLLVSSSERGHPLPYDCTAGRLWPRASWRWAGLMCRQGPTTPATIRSPRRRGRSSRSRISTRTSIPRTVWG